jgi:DNA-directed RNA polymerase specialized sigma24 family protein
VGDKAHYFGGVARKVYLEYIKKLVVVQQPPPEPEPVSEEAYECLVRCLGLLKSDDRDLIVQYYEQEKQAKIEHRRQLAEDLGIAPNALRIRLHRIRAVLLPCVIDCLNRIIAV